jgi:hypothetical protein
MAYFLLFTARRVQGSQHTFCFIQVRRSRAHSTLSSYTVRGFRSSKHTFFTQVGRSRAHNILSVLFRYGGPGLMAYFLLCTGKGRPRVHTTLSVVYR